MFLLLPEYPRIAQCMHIVNHVKFRFLFASHSFNTSTVLSFSVSRVGISGITLWLSAGSIRAACRNRVPMRLYSIYFTVTLDEYTHSCPILCMQEACEANMRRLRDDKKL
jgi:hypothetical protein